MAEIPERVRKRFWSRVAVLSEAECWPWRLSLGSHGYGQVGWWDGDHSVMVLAHRVAWELTVGSIPDELTIDHVCRNRRCCNPSQLRLLTLSENVADANTCDAQCRNGHPRTPENTYIRPDGVRECRICQSAARARYRARRRQAA